MDRKKGMVYLVGAGCGEADLITVRGLKCIKNCQVLIYDDLIAEELLAEAPEDAELIYMGKRSGRHSASQEEINAKIVEKALEGKVVCRLKGGDPFVFGRGGEEILALKAEDIPYEEVPGISSSIAIPAAAGIPVTHRKVARSFHVITAHSADTGDGLPEDMDKYAGLSGSLIFLMGLTQLPKISSRLIAAGKSPATPAAVISGGNSENPACVRGTLSDIAEKAEAAGVKSPVVIVVSETADFDFAPTIVKPLAGKLVGVTGTSQVSVKLSSSLRALGARVIEMEKSELVLLNPAVDFENMDGSWLVFTSGNGVKRFFDILKEKKQDIRKFSNCHFAVIGSATEKVLAGYGITADVRPDHFTGTELAKVLSEKLTAEDRVYLLRSARGGNELFDGLKEICHVEDISTYDVKPSERTAELAKNAVSKLDYLLFASAGGVETYHETIGEISDKTKCICIGETALAKLKKLYGIDGLLADNISVPSMVQKIVDDAQ